MTKCEVEMVLWFLAEGVDRSVMIRFTGHSEGTIARWLERAGRHSQAWHQRYLRQLSLVVLQLDELHTRVRTVEKARWWYRPERARKDHWQVAESLLYGQLVKRKQGRKLAFAIPRMLRGERKDLKVKLKAEGLSGLVQIAFIERVNLTIRRSVAPMVEVDAGEDQHIEPRPPSITSTSRRILVLSPTMASTSSRCCTTAWKTWVGIPLAWFGLRTETGRSMGSATA